MYEKFLIIRDDKILVGQNNQGFWYCKELPSPKEDLKKDMNTIIKILNFYNHRKEKKDKDKNIKEQGEK